MQPQLSNRVTKPADLIGKTIAAVHFDDDNAFIAFSDGSWAWLTDASGEYSEVWRMGLVDAVPYAEDQVAIGLMSQEDYDAACRAKESDRQHRKEQSDRAEYERLKRKFGQ